MRKMKTIGEQTGIKELDNVRQCGIGLYNLIDIVKVLGINKCELKSLLVKFGYGEIDKINGDYYISTNELKFILLSYNEEITRNYKGRIIINDNDLQEYGIVTDDRFMNDDDNEELIKQIREYRNQGVDLNSSKGNNVIKENLNNVYMDSEEIEDIDFDLIYKSIDEI